MDPLTGLLTRRSGEEEASALIEDCRRHSRVLSVLMLDLDHFKAINDRHGHLVGDAALAATGDVLKRRLRDEDVALRYGGEEILVLLPGTAQGEALEVAERVRAALEGWDAGVVASGLLLTGSIGVTSWLPGQPRDLARLVEQADLALYQAKQEGRNRVVAYSEVPSTEALAVRA